jgi:hypothetical protein
VCSAGLGRRCAVSPDCDRNVRWVHGCHIRIFYRYASRQAKLTSSRVTPLSNAFMKGVMREKAAFEAAAVAASDPADATPVDTTYTTTYDRAFGRPATPGAAPSSRRSTTPSRCETPEGRAAWAAELARADGEGMEASNANSSRYENRVLTNASKRF